MTPDERDELAAEFLRKLALADMKAWRAHWRMTERDGPDDALSPLQAQKIEPRLPPHVPHKPAPRVLSKGRDARPMSTARATAIAAGENTYRRHTPCKRCGGYLYYVTAQNCVVCHRIASAKSCAKRRAAKRAKSSAPAAAKPNVPRLTQFKRLGTFQAGSAPRAPQRLTARSNN
jgi:hypothetical protein